MEGGRAGGDFRNADKRLFLQGVSFSGFSVHPELPVFFFGSAGLHKLHYQVIGNQKYHIKAHLKFDALHYLVQVFSFF